MGGLSFLNSGLLLFAAATILPLLIWLLARRKPKRVVFPTLRFIKAGQEQEKKRSKLKNIILLIIRMLIILLVVLAVTRPLLSTKQFKPSAQHPPTAIALLLDTSFSMDYVDQAKTNLERAKDAIQTINSMCTEQDRLILLTSDEGWNRLHGQIYAGSIPSDILLPIQICHRPLSLDAMISSAKTKLQETQMSNSEMYLLSDGQKQKLETQPQELLHVIDLSQGQSRVNLSCSAAEVVPQLTEKSRRQTIRFKLTNHSKKDLDEVLVKVVLDGTKVAEKFVSLPGRQSVNQSMVIDLQQDGWQKGYVEVLDDRLTHDNRSYFAFPFYQTPRIAVISDRTQLPAALMNSLQVYSGSPGNIDILGTQQISRGVLERYQSLVFFAYGDASPKLRELIASLQESGRGALFCLDRKAASGYRAILGSVFSVSIGESGNIEKTLDYVNPHHFTTSMIAPKSRQFNKLSSSWQIRGTGSATLLSAAANPLALTRDKFVLWNFDLDSPESSFLLDASFAVFAYRSLEYVGSVIAGGQRGKIGDLLSAARIELPDGSSVSPVANSFQISIPGVHVLKESEGRELAMAVDVESGESEYERWNIKELKNLKLLGSKWNNTLFHTRLGHDLWKLLLAIALGLVVLEIILVKTEELRHTSKGEDSAKGSKQ